MSSSGGSVPLTGSELSVVENEEEIVNHGPEQLNSRSGGQQAEEEDIGEDEDEDEDDEVEHSEYDYALDSATVYDLSDFKKELREYLDNIETAGSAWSE